MKNKSSFAWPSMRDWWAALRYVFLVFTVLVAITMAGSFFGYERVAAKGHPWLPQKQCSGCGFCGMTRSFSAMSEGRWRLAHLLNRGGPILYGLGWLWLVSAGGVFARTQRSRRQNKRKGMTYLKSSDEDRGSR